MALWNPSQITTDLWLDASDAITITIDTGSSQWADKSGNNRHAEQATGSAQPTVSAAYQNGLDVLNFNGSSQFLSCGDVLDLGTGGLTAICVAQVNNAGGTNGVIYAKSIAGALAGRYHLGWLITANYITGNVTFDTSVGVSASAATTSTAVNIYGQVIDRSGAEKVLLNGVATSQSFTANTTNLNTTTRFLVGAYSNSNDTGIYKYHNGRICEIVLVRQTLSVGDIQLIEGYLAHKWGLASNLPADHPYKSAAPTIPDAVVLDKFISQPYSLWPDPYQAVSDQLYSIADPLDEVALEQLYSMVLEIWLTQHYGDVPVIGTSLAQPYGVAQVLTRWLEQRWDHAPELETSLDQPWALPDLLQAVSVQSYGIAAEVLTAVCDQLYHINANTTLFASLIQPYTIAAETARLYQFDTRLYIDGERIPYHALEWQATDTEFVWSCDFSVKDLAVAAKCVDGATITIVSAGDTWQLKCYGGWLLDKRHADTVYRISGYSQPWDLSQAPPLLGDIDGGMASAIVAGLASPHGIAVDWQMVDGYIATGKITANDQAPSELIKDIVHDGGGIVLSTPAGGLLVVAEEEVPIPDWPTTPPAQTIEAVLERISTSEQRDEQKGYNSFDVSDQLASGDSYRLEENLIDSRTKELRLILVPIAAEQQYVLTHSSDSGVSVEPFGIVSLQINDELVEFVAGSGRTSKPMYGLSGSAWQKENLGEVTWSEDGVLTAETAGYSLLKISYVTMFRKWIARDPRIEDVQFRAEKVTV